MKNSRASHNAHSSTSPEMDKSLSYLSAVDYPAYRICGEVFETPCVVAPVDSLSSCSYRSNCERVPGAVRDSI